MKDQRSIFLDSGTETGDQYGGVKIEVEKNGEQ